ncbi:hypothetical protein CAEBREN_14461 [Caenorhabditis brenneri]|uniref:GH18 domain-containing protein n=1 Tax=Caenorhabditis brenneri TaxID=135651 RepID=G0NN46_CAEBE|nr:hypothetical protein CAEBREN_14461 [Caenorhabditis brenneri]
MKNRHSGSRIGVKTDPQKIQKISDHICLWFLLLVSIAFISFVLTKLITAPLRNKSFEPCKPRIVGIFHIASSRDATFDQISKLTHIVFNHLRYQRNGTIRFVNEEEKETFKRMNKLSKKTKVKTLFELEIGDYSDYIKADIPGLMKHRNRQLILVDSIVSFITDHSLDGVYLHWEPPHTTTVQLFVTTLFKDMRDELTKATKQTNRKEPFIITTTIQRKNITLDFDEVLKYVDFLNLETDRIYGSEPHRSSWNEAIGPPTPIYSGHYKNSEDNMNGAARKYSCWTVIGRM